MQKGALIISLDFELYWGVRGSKSINDYKSNILGARSVIPSILKLFNEYRIHATWATVGFLFFENKNDLMMGVPRKTPAYLNKKLSPYLDIDNIGTDEKEDPFHYAPSLIKLIRSYPNQEIATHTFSHYYCLEEGQDKDAFRDDLKSAICVAKKYNVDIESMVFPRNQINNQYLQICRKAGIKSYRGNGPSLFSKNGVKSKEFMFKRALRLLDAYINLSGHNAYSPNSVSASSPMNIPSSRFLRPYSKRFKFLESLRLHRILSDLDYAAKNNLIYHLWWHPHNFGNNSEKNILFLKKILSHFLNLQKIYGIESLNMRELTNKLKNNG